MFSAEIEIIDMFSAYLAGCHAVRWCVEPEGKHYWCDIWNRTDFSVGLARDSPAAFNYRHRQAKLSTQRSDTALLISTGILNHTLPSPLHRGWTCLQECVSPV